MIFNQPQFLWGLLAVAIPILIHLFNLRRYRKIYFSNVQRLSAIQSENRRRNTLREWLVLAMRVVAVGMLVVAFAQPIIPHNDQQLKAGSTVVSIYIDNSFSMENASSEGTQLEAAKQKAREVAMAYHASDRFQLLDNNMSGKEYRWLNRDELIESIDDITISPTTHTLGEIITSQRGFMHQSGATNQHAYVISDFQKSISNLEEIASDSTSLVTLIPLPAIATDNIYIDTVALDAPAYFAGSTVTATATIVNSGSHMAEKIPVKLYINGQERALSTIDLAAGSSGKAELHFTIDQDGWLDGRIEIIDHPVTFDDNYHFALHIGEHIRLLEIDNDPQANPHLARLFAADSSIAYSHVPVAQFDATQLEDLDIIILNEVAAIGSGLAHELDAWVTAGGSLLIVPATSPAATNLNPMLTALHAPLFGTWVDQPVKATLIDQQSSLYRNVFSTQSNDIEMPTLRGHYLLNTGNALKQSIIHLADGSDMLTMTPHGNGNVYLLTAPLTEAATDFVNQALFVPTLYNIALYSRPLPTPAHTIGDNSPILLHSHFDLNATPPHLTCPPHYDAIADIRQSGTHQILVVHDDLTTAGIYTLADEHIALNYDHRESQLDFLTHSEISSLTNLPTLSHTDRPIDQQIRARQEGTPLWRWCILIALVALAVETALLLKKKHAAT